MLKKNKLLLLFFLFALSSATLAWAKVISPWLARSVNYDRLEYLFDVGDWENANAETKNLLLRLSRRNFIQLYYIKPSLYNLNNIPCQDLQTIDKLWSQHSNGKFGLAIQLRIWQERMQNINWKNYRSGSLYPDFEKAHSIFDEIIKEPRQFPQDISAIPPGKLPSQNWIWTATADPLDPVLTAKNFYSRVKDCMDK